MKTKIWQPCNIYKTAKLGYGVSVGMFSEIGEHVEVGSGTRIGMGCFICEGVSIGAGCFIGPKCCFTNDRFPPSPRKNWERTYVKSGASIGAGCVIRCGITIGAFAKVGCGSVVTKSIPAGETWAGVPARKMKGKS